MPMGPWSDVLFYWQHRPRSVDIQRSRTRDAKTLNKCLNMKPERCGLSLTLFLTCCSHPLLFRKDFNCEQLLITTLASVFRSCRIVSPISSVQMATSKIRDRNIRRELIKFFHQAYVGRKLLSRFLSWAHPSFPFKRTKPTINWREFDRRQLYSENCEKSSSLSLSLLSNKALVCKFVKMVVQ
jgi:hypothetical protein